MKKITKFKKSTRYLDHKERFNNLWSNMVIRPERVKELNLICDKIQKNIEKFANVEIKTGVPSSVVAAIFQKEASLNFNKCLHNGDPWNKVTVNVPKGRGPFISWEESAVDALIGDHPYSKKRLIAEINKTNVWDITEALWFMESYNGWGYYLYHSETSSPYLWAATKIYTAGGYPRDGKYSATHVVKNPGAAAILKTLELRKQLDLTLVDSEPHHNVVIKAA